MGSTPPMPRRIATIVLCALIAGCGAAAETRTPRSKTVTLGNGAVSGKRPIATAQGTVDKPSEISLSVVATPKQRVTVAWALACPGASDLEPRASTSGSYVTTTPNVRALKLPTGAIAQCAIDATARLARSGEVEISAIADTR